MPWATDCSGCSGCWSCWTCCGCCPLRMQRDTANHNKKHLKKFQKPKQTHQRPGASSEDQLHTCTSRSSNSETPQPSPFLPFRNHTWASLGLGSLPVDHPRPQRCQLGTGGGWFWYVLMIEKRWGHGWIQQIIGQNCSQQQAKAQHLSNVLT